MTKPLTIGEVINRLKPEFPEATVSKLRFLESEGLIHPARSHSGYREFGPGDIERIRYILRQQRDHFLPLKVIKSKLTAWQRGEEPTVAAPAGAPPETYFATSGVEMSDEELARAAGVTGDVVRRLTEAGVLERGSGGFDEDDLAIVRAAHRLLSHGFEPRHLRTVRLAANRESDMLGQLTGALLRHRSPASRQQAAEILADSAQAIRELQDAMLRAQLRGMLGA
ncbi:MAG TPA: MerR family transcriptional regulator [Gemmatimonadales bacterium]|nr:MerR family transcriptional regulator [Gemmatimonadales bacterium]